MGFDLLLPVRHRVGSHAGINLAAATTWPLPRMALIHALLMCRNPSERGGSAEAAQQLQLRISVRRAAGPCRALAARATCHTWMCAARALPRHALLLARHPGFCRVVLTAAVHGLPVGHLALASAAHLRAVRQRLTVAFQQQEGKWHPAKGACVDQCVVALSN